MPIKLKTRTFTAYLFLTACSLLGAANTPPQITAVQPFYGASVMVDHPTLYKFYISDLETAPSNLQLSFASSNPALFPTTNAVFHWFLHDADGQHWYLTLVPAFGQTGTATNTLTVSDGTNSVSTNFVITVTPPPPGAARFVNTRVISIPDVGAATPYPSPNIVTGMIGTITNLTLTLSKINHQYIKDVHMLLVGPTGRGMVVFSRISSVPVTDITATLLDAAPDWSPLPPDFELWSEQFRPADYATNSAFANNFPSPAPDGPYAPTLFANAFSNAFNGLPANGTWSLYIYDESAPSQGNIVGGWSLMIATDGGSAAPTISDIANQLTTVNTATPAIPFTINDTDTPVNNLTLSKGSSNTTLVPTNNIVFGGSGANRTVTVTPVTGQTGTATITVTVSDGTSSSSDSFLLTVGGMPLTVTGITAANKVYDGTTDATLNTAGATLVGVVSGDDVMLVTGGAMGTKSFTNSSVITIPNIGAGAPYPSTINVTGLGGTISNVMVTLRNLSHTYASDVDVVLVGPAGQKVLVMSDAGIGNANNVTVTLSDGAATALPASGLVSGAFRPTNLNDNSSGGDNFPVPALAGPYATALSAFNGTAANGTWSLYVLDDGPGDLGSFAGGWSLTLTTTGATAGAVGTFADENVGNGKTVQIVGLTLGGPDAGNYVVTQPTTTANITTKGLTVSGIAANNKVYDNTTTASLDAGGAALVGVVSGDAVALQVESATGTFVNETVGNDKTVQVAGLTIDGADAGNYTVTQPTTTANITAKTVTPVIVANDKAYDGSTTATLGSQTLTGTIGADVVTLGVSAANFDTKNVGIGKTVTATTLTLSGVDAGNYVLGAASATDLADITAKLVTPVIVANDKAYDGITTATLSSQSVTGTIGAEVVTLGVGAANFDNKNIGTSKTVTATTLTLGGVDAGNYVLGAASATDLANITAKSVSPVIVANDKPYDGDTTATLSSQSVTGTIGGEVVTLGVGAANFDTKSVGTSKTVTATTLSLGGANAGNYVLGAASATNLADITAKTVTPVIVANNKLYDGHTLATLRSRSVTGTIGAEVVALGVGTANFDTKNVGTGKTVTATTLSLGGADAGNYVLDSAMATDLANITAKPVTPVIVANDKPYDGNTTATLSSQSVTGTIDAEVVTLGVGAANFDTENIGTGKTVTGTTLTLSGADASNYTLDSAPATDLANITAKAVTPVIVANNKTYDGNTTATLSSHVVTGTIGAGVVTLGVGAANFDTKNAGTGKTVTATALSLGGADAGNYVLDAESATDLADITKAELTVTADDKSRAYGAANPTLTATISGFINWETLATSGITGSPDFSTSATNNSAAGSYPITTTTGSLSAANYSFSFVDGTLAVFIAQPVVLSLTGAGTTNVVLTWSAISSVTYRVQYRPELNTEWVDVVPDVTATDNTASTVDNLGGAKQRFYRILIVP